MTQFIVQFVLPVDNPVSNVSMRKGKGFVEFLVPLNHPDAHNMGFQDLIAAAELSGLIHLSPGLNKKRSTAEKKNSKPCWEVAADATAIDKKHQRQ